MSYLLLVMDVLESGQISESINDIHYLRSKEELFQDVEEILFYKEDSDDFLDKTIDDACPDSYVRMKIYEFYYEYGKQEGVFEIDGNTIWSDFYKFCFGKNENIKRFKDFKK